VENPAPISPEKIYDVPSKHLWGTRKMPDLAGLTALIPHADTPHDLTTVRAPFTGETLGTVPICTTEDVQMAIQHARTAQPAWHRCACRSARRFSCATTT